MIEWESHSDDELLAATRRSPEAFAAFYRRHEAAVLRFFLARTGGNGELSIDLAAETFAGALRSARRFRTGGPPAEAWLFGIARNTLRMSLRRGRVEERMRKRVGLEPIAIDEDTLERIARLEVGLPVLDLVEDLPPDQRAALRARVVDEREYVDIAHELQCSEAVVRQRVSRALRSLRSKAGDLGV